MTSRTRSPQETVAEFVSLAVLVIDQAEVVYSERLDRDRHPVTLEVTVGAGWTLTDEGTAVLRGTSPELSDLGQAIARTACAALDIKAQSRLLLKMQPPAEERSNYVPHFIVALTLQPGDVFTLKVTAKAGQYAAAIGFCEGVVGEPQKVAA